MNTRNLLSPKRQAAQRQRRATRRWIRIDAIYGTLLLVVAVAYACSTPTVAGPSARAAEPPVDFAKLNATLAGLRQQSATLTANLRSVSEVADRPDWSFLLAALAGAVGDDVVLSAVDATPASVTAIATSAAVPVAAAADALPRRVTLVGVARSQTAATQFVLRIEAFGLFAKVNLTQTAPRPVQGIDGVGFQLVCVLPEGER